MSRPKGGSNWGAHYNSTLAALDALLADTALTAQQRLEALKEKSALLQSAVERERVRDLRIERQRREARRPKPQPQQPQPSVIEEFKRRINEPRSPTPAAQTPEQIRKSWVNALEREGRAPWQAQQQQPPMQAQPEPQLPAAPVQAETEAPPQSEELQTQPEAFEEPPLVFSREPIKAKWERDLEHRWSQQ